MGVMQWLANTASSAGQGVMDTGRFLRSMVDTSYVPPAFSEPVSSDPKIREEQRKEANRYAAAAQTIAKNTETGLVTLGQTGGAAIGALATMRSGNPKIIIGAAVTGAEVVESIYDGVLEYQGEAPTRSLKKTYSPLTGDYGTIGNIAAEVAGINGDAHYYNGGDASNHPKVLERQRMIEEIKREAFAKYGLSPTGQPLNGSQNTALETASLPAPVNQPTNSNTILGSLTKIVADAFNSLTKIVSAVFQHLMNGLTGQARNTDVPANTVVNHPTNASATLSPNVQPPTNLPKPIHMEETKGR